ncbi:FAD:protein FMN transferase [Vagococcus coleopterorum]|uniref:FAD:protein FMN transferase n=1 Tax=Vagococcus coleopterorum TaxID=2714946 RepID=A0A6G8ALV5_9ENTE|nr:FAD:protein FMN transferase [Vagococcus coleopterorum]QIL45977.1 FAD:protein FMN transferase [Vagococcus coleopterorum]
MRKSKYLISLLLLPIVLLVACGSKGASLNQQPYSEQQFLMGTYVRVQIYDNDKEDVLKKAFDRVKELADKITVSEPGSEIDKVNDNAGIKSVELSDDVYPLVKRAYEYSEEYETGFDMTIGPITKMWHIGFDDARKPAQSEIDAALPLVDHKDVELDDEKQTIFLKKKGMELDLGAIAKGYITDEVVKLLQKNDVTTAIVDLGGNVYVLGDSPKEGKEYWKVGIQDPNQARNTVVGSVTSKNQSLVTSGIYERNLTVNGETFHHLFNPKTGYPFDNKIAGVSIISQKSIDGDGLSTSIFSMGLKEGLDHIEGLKDVEAIFVTLDNKIYISSGLVDNFKINKESGYSLGNNSDL